MDTATLDQTPISRGEFAHRAAVFCMSCRHYRDAPCSRHCWSDDHNAWEDER